jgi:hypothetical protein
VLLAFNQYVGVSPWPIGDWASLDPSTTCYPQFHRRIYAVAAEAINFGAMVSIIDVGGVLNMRNANATDNTKLCAGYCSTGGGVLAGAVGEFIVGSGIIAVSGLVRGTPYWLATSNGQITPARPTAAGTIAQYIGIALSTTLLLTNIGFFTQN